MICYDCYTFRCEISSSTIIPAAGCDIFFFFCLCSDRGGTTTSWSTPLQTPQNILDTDQTLLFIQSLHSSWEGLWEVTASCLPGAAPFPIDELYNTAGDGIWEKHGAEDQLCSPPQCESHCGVQFSETVFKHCTLQRFYLVLSPPPLLSLAIEKLDDRQPGELWASRKMVFGRQLNEFSILLLTLCWPS